MYPVSFLSFAGDTMKNQLLLLHGIENPMGGNKMRYYRGYNPITRKPTRRRHRRSMYGVGATPELKASFNAVKDIAILSAVAAVSAVAIDFMFNSIKNKTDPTKNFLGLKIGSNEDYLARAGVGIVASILYKKFIEKGRISKVDVATGLALGPTVVSAYGIFSNLLSGPAVLVNREAAKTAKLISGMGYIEPIRAGGFKPALAGGRMAMIGAQNVGREGGFKPQLEPLKQVSWGSY